MAHHPMGHQWPVKVEPLNGHYMPPGQPKTEPGLLPSNGYPAAQSRPPLAPMAGGKPPLGPPATPPRSGGARRDAFKFQYHSRAELEAISLRQCSRKDGVTEAVERKRRKMYVRWMQDLATALALERVVHSTAVVYMHRYFAVRSMDKTDIFLMGLAALFAASKSENHPRNLNDIIKEAIRPAKDRFGVELKAAAYLPRISSFRPVRNKRLRVVWENPTERAQLREWVLTAERALLYTLGFKLNVLHPYTALVKNSTKYKLDSYALNEKVQISQAAVLLLDAYQLTTLPLQYPPLPVALAALRFSIQIMAKQGKMKGPVPLVDGKEWWEAAGGKREDLDDIQLQLREVINVDEGEGDATPASAASGSLPPSLTPTQQSSPGADPLDAAQAIAAGAAIGHVSNGAGSGEMAPTVDAAAPVADRVSPDRASDASDTTGAMGSLTPADSAKVAAPAAGLPLAGSKRAAPDSGGDASEPSAKRASPPRSPPRLAAVKSEAGVGGAVGGSLELPLLPNPMESGRTESMEPGELAL